MIDRMVGIAAGEGLPFDFERIRPGNTFKAHRLLHLAKLRSLQDRLKERLLAATYPKGEPIGDEWSLLRLATRPGSTRMRCNRCSRATCTQPTCAPTRIKRVRSGSTGVPFFVIGNRYAVAGVQPEELLLQALTRAWDELPEAPGAARRRRGGLRARWLRRRCRHCRRRAPLTALRSRAGAVYW